MCRRSHPANHPKTAHGGCTHLLASVLEAWRRRLCCRRRLLRPLLRLLLLCLLRLARGLHLRLALRFLLLQHAAVLVLHQPRHIVPHLLRPQEAALQGAGRRGGGAEAVHGRVMSCKGHVSRAGGLAQQWDDAAAALLAGCLARQAGRQVPRSSFCAPGVRVWGTLRPWELPQE